jgi:hypothetical protein
MQKKLLVNMNVDFDATVQHLIINSAFVKHVRKLDYKEAMHQLFIDFKKAYDSFRSEFLHNILIEFGIPMNLVKLIRVCVWMKPIAEFS